MAHSIDQVMFNGARRNSSSKKPSRSNHSINETAPLPTPVSSRPSSSRQGSPKREQVGMSLRSHPPPARNSVNGRISEEKLEKEFQNLQSTSATESDGSKQSKQSSRSSRSNKNSFGSNHKIRGSSVTDYFSPEVFQMVIHNPTTAHRFLKFCQSRNCGENLSFLQKVC